MANNARLQRHNCRLRKKHLLSGYLLMLDYRWPALGAAGSSEAYLEAAANQGFLLPVWGCGLPTDKQQAMILHLFYCRGGGAFFFLPHIHKNG